ncbi:hypothetical protein Btru_070358 [Bulinus truncatus]|nr:hypothetical protein Btru_070358 [Bulinus truncatus]
MDLVRKALRFIFRKKNTDTTLAVNIPETNDTDRSGKLPENGAKNNHNDVTVNGENEDTNRQNVNERDQNTLAPDLNDLEDIQQDLANEPFGTQDANAFIDEDIPNVYEKDQQYLSPELNDLENIQQVLGNEPFGTENANAVINEDIQNVNEKNQHDFSNDLNDLEKNLQDLANEHFGTEDANAFTDDDIQNVNEKDQQDLSPDFNDLENVQHCPANEVFGTEDTNAFTHEDIQNVNEKDQQDLFPDLNDLENIQQVAANELLGTENVNAVINEDIQNVNGKDQQDLSPDLNDLEDIQQVLANEHFSTDDANAFKDDNIQNVNGKDQKHFLPDLNNLENIQKDPANKPFCTQDANAFIDEDIPNVYEKDQQYLSPDLNDLENIQQVPVNEPFGTDDANAFINEDIQNVNEKDQQDLSLDLNDLENIQQVLGNEPFGTENADAVINEDIQNINEKNQHDFSNDLNDLENNLHDLANEHFGTVDANAFTDDDIQNVHGKDQQDLSPDFNDLENVQQCPANEVFGTEDAHAFTHEDIPNVNEKDQQDLFPDLNDLENIQQVAANELFGTENANAVINEDIQNVNGKDQQDLSPDLNDLEDIQQVLANEHFSTDDANTFIDDNIQNANEKDQKHFLPDLNNLENIQKDPANEPFCTQDTNAFINEDIPNVYEKDQQYLSPDLNDLENIQQVPVNEPFGTDDANAFIDENIQNVNAKDQQDLSPDLNNLENIQQIPANELFGTEDANAFINEDIQNVNEKDQQDLSLDLNDLENIQRFLRNEPFGTENANAVINEDIQNVNEKNQHDFSNDLNDLENNLHDLANEHFGTDDANAFTDDDIQNVNEKDQQDLSPDFNDLENVQQCPANEVFGTEDAHAFTHEDIPNVNEKDQQDLFHDLNDLENVQQVAANELFGTENANAVINEDIQNVYEKNQQDFSNDHNDLDNNLQDLANEHFGTEDANAFTDDDIQNVNEKDQQDLSPDFNDLENVQQCPANEVFGTEDAHAFTHEDIPNVNEKDQQDLFLDLNDLENIQQIAANELFGTENANAVINEDIQNVNEKNQQDFSNDHNDLDNNLQDLANEHFGTEDANVFINVDIPNVYEKDQQYLSPDFNDLEDIQQDPANHLFGTEDAKAFIDEDIQNVNVKDQQDISPDIIEVDKRDKETLHDRDTKARDNFESEEHAELLRIMSKNVETLLECIQKKKSSDEEIDGDKNDDANEEQKVNVHQQIGHTINILANEINSSPSCGTSSPNESSNAPGGMSLNLNIGDVGQRSFNGNNAPMYPIQLDENPTSGWSNTQQAANQFYHPSHQAGSPTTGSAYTTQAVNQIIVPDGFMRKMNDAERNNCDTSYTRAENVSQRESQTERLNQSSEDLLSISEEETNEDSSDVIDEEDEFESCSDENTELSTHNPMTFQKIKETDLEKGEISSQQFECVVFCLGSVKGLNETRAENVVIIVDTSRDMAIAAQNMGENAEKFYKSKIEIVRNAVKALVDEIWMNQPDSKIALVTFSNNVRVHTMDDVLTVNEEYFEDSSKLIKHGENYSNNYFTPVKSENIQTSLNQLNAEDEGDSTMISAIYVGLGMGSQSKVIVFTDKDKFSEINENVFNNINDVAHSRQITLSVVSCHPSDTSPSGACTPSSQKVMFGPTTDILTHLIKIMSQEMISGDKTAEYLTAKKFFLETSHEQRDMSQATENEMHLSTRQNETKFFPAIRLELENIADTPGQDACLANFIWRFLVPHRFIKKTGNTLKILISQLNEALGNHTSYESKLIEISETLTQEMSTTVVYKEECKEMLRNLRQSLEKYSDIVETIQKSLRSSHSMETSIQLAKLEIDKLKGLASALDEAMANLEKASEENEERIFKKTEERLSIMEKKIESSFGELKKLLLPSLTESSQAQLSSFMQFGSRYILADDDGDVATNILRIDLSKITDKCKMTMAGIYSNVCDNFRCKAFYSHLDICTRNGSVYNWKCRFCCKIKSIPNIILYSPNAYDVCYIHNMNMDSQINIMNYKIVFLIDVSGNMSKKCEGTQTSRLDAVKTAVINKIKQLTVKCPKRRVGLVVYNDTVTAYGAHYPHTVHGNLYDMEYLLRQGRNCSDLQPLESKRWELITSLNGWHAQGRDALGPAILVGLGMMNNSRGSKMIICNNGGGNTGIGVSNKVGAWEFYQEVVFQAKKNAVTISINSFDNSTLSLLGAMARETGGTVRRISPLDLFIHMDEDISRNVLATNAEIKIILPREMYVHVSGSNDNTRSVVSFPVGNIVDSNNQIFCFQFGFKKDFHLNTRLKKSATGDFLIPVQVQVMFHDSDEKRITRLLNFLQETSARRDVVDLCMNAEAIVTDLGHKAAKSLLHPLWYPSVVKQFIETAKEYKKMDKIKFRPELVCKLDMIILLLEKIQKDERTDEISALLSNLVTMS